MKHRITILEQSPLAAARLSRSACAANEMLPVQTASSVAEAEQQAPTALGCHVQFLPAVLASPVLAGLPTVVWCNEVDDATLLTAVQGAGESIGAFLGWPAHLSAPRSDEALLAFQLALANSTRNRPTIDATAFVAFGGAMRDWRVMSSNDRDDTLTELAKFIAPVAGRQDQRITEVAHELLMNALYDAPVRADGTHRFAHDRAANIELAPEEAATCRVATDGQLLALEVVDVFGGLRRPVLLRALARGMAAARASQTDKVLDTSHGGAGLGLHRIYASSTAMIVRVTPRQETRITAIFDLALTPRELRFAPTSLVFAQGA